MRVYIKENAYLGKPDGTWYAISGATMMCVASHMTREDLESWCARQGIDIIRVIPFEEGN